MNNLFTSLFGKNRGATLRPPRLERGHKSLKRTLPVPNFRNELELKTFLANNLEYIEPGLKLFARGSWTGLEVPCQFSEWSKPGLIDILTEDREGGLLVIEVKMDGKAAAFGQLLGYMAWMNRWACTADPGGRTRAARSVRGAIVVRRASPMLIFLVRSYPEFPITVYETENTLSLLDERLEQSR